MQVVGITSSPKRNGNTATLLRAVLNGAAQGGAEVEEIFLPEYDIKFCKGCQGCMRNGSCHLEDDFNLLKEKISKADGIIFGSPNYAFSPNAMIKRLIERFGLFEYMTSSVLGGKYVIGLATTAGQGAQKVAKYLTSIGRDGVFQRSYVSDIVTASGTFNIPVAENENKLKEARQAGQNLAKDIKTKKTYPFQNLFRRAINYFIIKPRFTKNVLSQKDKNMKGVYENLVKRGLIADG